MIRLDLPFPPSTNHYWKTYRGRHVIAAAGKKFAREVYYCAKQQLPGHRAYGVPLRIQVDLYPPDRRRRDLDNFAGKALYDALQRADVYIDDSQIRESHNVWRDPCDNARCTVIIEPL